MSVLTRISKVNATENANTASGTETSSSLAATEGAQMPTTKSNGKEKTESADAAAASLSSPDKARLGRKSERSRATVSPLKPQPTIYQFGTTNVLAVSGKATEIDGGKETIKAIRRKPLTASTIYPHRQ